ncbi:galactose-binding like protein [Decorospora gaudefroyi]|uniref:Galactose-binding like protein n=1 Tax=Decorospora gaudefroyi TaxID=184978 RepID=A0A6A5K436_9PLEO|nr:galactose-binding like protein [Decorospora gaudefroyi]
MSSSRSTFSSGGKFAAFRTELEDGKSLVEWMRMQPWYTGTFATIRRSYLGYVQWALLCEPPEDLVAVQYQWSSPSGDDHSLSYIIGEANLWLHDILSKSDISDPHYSLMRFERALERTNVPVLIVTGWYDLFHEGCNVSLTVGPWKHMDLIAASKGHRQGFDWTEQHLGGRVAMQRASVAEYFGTSAQEWRSLPDFAPATTLTTFFLGGGGRLTREVQLALEDLASSSFTYYPRKPTPSIRGLCLLTPGSVNDSAHAERSDVLVFDTAPLENDLEFCDTPLLKLAHPTSSSFADVFVRISEVNERGRSRNITEVFKQTKPKHGIDGDLELTLSYYAHRVLRGKGIRLAIAGGGCFPHYARNRSKMRAVEHTVYHNAG